MRGEFVLPDHVQTLPEALTFWAEHTPHAPALRAVDRGDLSHRALAEAVARAASRLAARGVKRGDFVALLLPPGIDAWVALLGTMAAAVAIPFTPESSSNELSRDLQRLPVRLVVTDRANASAGHAIITSLGFTTTDVEELLAPGPPPTILGAVMPVVAPGDVATVLHTSGTTGFPKRAPRPHATFVAAARAERDSSGLTSRDVLLLATGPHAKAGQANLLGALLSGGSCVLAPGFDPHQFPVWLHDHRPTWLFATAAQLNQLLAGADGPEWEGTPGPESRLRFVRTGSQPMTPGTVARVEERLGAVVLDGYGMTEVSCIAASGPSAADRREGSCGRPWAVVVRIVDDGNQDVPPGGTGEVVVRGPTLFPGYLDDSEANAAAFLPGGWFRTGDLGYLDEGGYLHLTGRRGELINRGGDKIAPVEIDQVLLSHPAVAEAAAFAVPDARLGEDVVVAVVFEPGAAATARELRRWAADRLSLSKAPRRIWMVERLPRTRTGKVQRGALRDRYLGAGSDPQIV